MRYPALGRFCQISGAAPGRAQNEPFEGVPAAVAECSIQPPRAIVAGRLFSTSSGRGRVSGP